MFREGKKKKHLKSKNMVCKRINWTCFLGSGTGKVFSMLKWHFLHFTLTKGIRSKSWTSFNISTVHQTFLYFNLYFEINLIQGLVDLIQRLQVACHIRPLFYLNYFIFLVLPKFKVEVLSKSYVSVGKGDIQGSVSAK